MRPLLLLVLLAACSNSTGPAPLDPTVLIVNESNLCTGSCSPDTLFFTWRDGQGIAGTISVAPGTWACARFTARVDSAYFTATTRFTNAAYTQPWFDPATHPSWTMMVAQSVGGILVTDVSPNMPC